MLKKWYQDFSSQPHQPFFTSGFVFLILSIFILFGNYNNLFNLDVPLSVYHGYALVFLVFIQFFLGFLFVVFPRFLVQAQIKQSLYMNQFHVYLLASIVFWYRKK